MASGKDCREKNTEIFASKGQEQIFLFCSVDANFIKNSQIRWRRNNQEITLSPPYSIAWERGKLLMIRPVIVGITDGYYECVANLGSVELQKSVKITVKNGKFYKKNSDYTFFSIPYIGTQDIISSKA